MSGNVNSIAMDILVPQLLMEHPSMILSSSAKITLFIFYCAHCPFYMCSKRPHNVWRARGKKHVNIQDQQTWQYSSKKLRLRLVWVTSLEQIFLEIFLRFVRRPLKSKSNAGHSGTCRRGEMPETKAPLCCAGIPSPKLILLKFCWHKPGK